MNKLLTILFCFSCVVLTSCDETQRPRFDDSSLYVFGDDLSDTGNANIETSGLTPDKNYYHGRFSNGPLYIDKLATQLNTPLLPSRLFGSNFAHAGSNSLGMSAQIFNFAENVGFVVNPNWTVVIWSGANDLISLISQPENEITLITDAIAHIRFSILSLSAMGATRIVILNQINMARLPRLHSADENDPGIQLAAEEWSINFNTSLDEMLDELDRDNSLSTIRFDVFSLVENIITDPSNYGLQNIHESCYVKDESAIALTGNESICQNPDEYLFWDSVHPTTAAHEIFYQQLILKIQEN